MKVEGGNGKVEGPPDLRVRTKAFALDIIRLVGSLPKSMEAQVLGRQVLRSGTSVGANYCEAYRGRSRAEFIAKIGDSLREIEETSYWLELLEASGITSNPRIGALRKESDELTAILVTILRKARAGIKARG